MPIQNSSSPANPKSKPEANATLSEPDITPDPNGRKSLALKAFKSYAPGAYDYAFRLGQLGDPINAFLSVLQSDLHHVGNDCFVLNETIGAPERRLFGKYYNPGIKIDDHFIVLRRIVFLLHNTNLEYNSSVYLTTTCNNDRCLNSQHIALRQVKITDADRISIAHEYNAGKSISTIAKERNVTLSTIQRLIQKEHGYANIPVETQKRARPKPAKTCFYKEQVMQKLNTRSVMRDNGCRIYLGAPHKSLDGGGISYQGKSIRVHYFVWECANGAIPENHIIVRTCGDNMCFALNHLKLESTNQFGLSDEAVKIIATSTKFHAELAREFHTYPSKIKRIQKFYRLQNALQNVSQDPSQNNT